MKVELITTVSEEVRKTNYRSDQPVILCMFPVGGEVEGWRHDEAQPYEIMEGLSVRAAVKQSE